MSPVVITSCRISRPTAPRAAGELEILRDVQKVAVHRNPFLDEIAKEFRCWKSHPIISVDKCVYRIKCVEMTDSTAVFLQQYVNVYYKANGKMAYDVIRHRRVEVTFDVHGTA